MRNGSQHSPRRRWDRALLAIGVAAVSAAACAQQGLVPETIKARVNALVKTCVDAGGRLGDMRGQGRFVLPYDFTGDGRTDFVVSEGNVPCTGHPELFRTDGLSRVELHIAAGNGTRLAFADRLLAYRVLGGQPAKLQIARRGTGCGPGSSERTRCGAELRWNAAQSRFDEAETGREGGGSLPLVRPAVVDGGTAPETGDTSAAAATASSPDPAPPATAPPNGDGFMARCRRETQAKYPQMQAQSLEASCGEARQAMQAALPVADAMLAAAPAGAGERPDLAALRARLPQVRWSAVPPAGDWRAGRIAGGRMGNLEVGVTGGSAADSLWFYWQQVGGGRPYDIAAALAERGARVRALGCYHFGASEQNRVYVVEAAGRPLFAVASYDRGAPFASSIAHQTLTIDLTGRVPTLASLQAEHRDPPWQAVCPY